MCYRDSPCNEVGTQGGNDNGCALMELYPFYKCQCKEYWDGYRCQYYNCPCKNGGKCAKCLVPECKSSPVCICQPNWKGDLCEGLLL